MLYTKLNQSLLCSQHFKVPTFSCSIWLPFHEYLISIRILCEHLYLYINVTKIYIYINDDMLYAKIYFIIISY